MNRLSARMAAVAALCLKKEGGCGADVGCDHGYVSIFLVKTGIFEKMLAMDLRKGPLCAAKENISKEGLGGSIECRLSDGLASLNEDEADAVILAGMGGELIRRILMEGKNKLRKTSQLILQPQSEVRSVREYLIGNGYTITAEDMVFEDGKFYPMFRAEPGKAGDGIKELFLEYGRQTLENRHPVLKKYLDHRLEMETAVSGQLKSAAENGSERSEARLSDLEKELNMLRQALSYYE